MSPTFRVLPVFVTDFPVWCSVFPYPQAFEVEDGTRIHNQFTIVALSDLPYLMTEQDGWCLFYNHRKKESTSSAYNYTCHQKSVCDVTLDHLVTFRESAKSNLFQRLYLFEFLLYLEFFFLSKPMRFSRIVYEKEFFFYLVCLGIYKVFTLNNNFDLISPTFLDSIFDVKKKK